MYYNLDLKQIEIPQLATVLNPNLTCASDCTVLTV